MLAADGDRDLLFGRAFQQAGDDLLPLQGLEDWSRRAGVAELRLDENIGCAFKMEDEAVRFQMGDERSVFRHVGQRAGRLFRDALSFLDRGGQTPPEPQPLPGR